MEDEIIKKYEYEDLRFESVDTKKIFEISKEDAKKLQIFIELTEGGTKC